MLDPRIANELSSMREDISRWMVTNPRLVRLVLPQYTKLRIHAARQDPDIFMEFVFRDRNMRPVLQAPVHERMQELAGLYDRLIVWGFVESAKTSQLAIGRTLWRLGREPNLQIAVVTSAEKKQSGKIMAALMQYIKSSRELRAVFPHLKPGRPWGMGAFNIDRTSMSKDYTAQATSIETGSLQGSRIDLMIIDDIITHNNSLTQENRDKIYAQLKSTSFLGRLTEDADVVWLGNALHPEDAMHRMSREGRWHFARFPVLDHAGRSTWPTQWSNKRIELKRVELGPDEFARQMMCIARDDSAGRFKREWINKCMDRGLGKTMLNTLGGVEAGYGVYTGVDLGHRKQAGADFTCLYTLLVHPNDDRELINLETGRWAGPEIVNRVIDTHNRYNSIVYVENNGAQQYIVDFTKDISAAPVKPLFTGKNKVHPDNGIEGMAVEIGNGKWIIPSAPGRQVHPEIEHWVNEMIYYDPKAHAGDRLMASWIAREGSKQWRKRPRGQQGSLDTVSR